MVILNYFSFFVGGIENEFCLEIHMPKNDFGHFTLFGTKIHVCCMKWLRVSEHFAFYDFIYFG